MTYSRRRLITRMSTILLMSFFIIHLITTLYVAASPARQFPTNSVTIISDPAPADEAGQLPDLTYASGGVMDPDPQWRAPTFDDSSWQPAYPAATQPQWGTPVGGGTLADFIWGGATGTDVGGRYEIPNAPAPQALFVRKNFCIPINANINTVQTNSNLDIQIAATPGNTSVYYNNADIAVNLVGQEDGSIHSIAVDPTIVQSVRRLGRNTLAIRARDDVADTYAALAYHVQFGFGIDPTAITLNSTPPSGSAVINTPITFGQSHGALNGDTPFTYIWDFGDGTISTQPAPVKTYTTAGTYTVTLTINDRYGCPSAPVTMQYTVLDPTPTPTPTNTPTPQPGTSTPPPTSPPPTRTPAPEPPKTSAPPPPTPVPPTMTPIPTPTLFIPLLPATGEPASTTPSIPVVSIICGTLLVLLVIQVLRRKHFEQ